ncbi:hypothetical protein AALA00_11840 [Lachnospiraceae bacterium 46-15]
MPKNTDELLNTLKTSPNLSSFLQQEAEELTEQIPLYIYLNNILNTKELKKSDVIRRSGLDRGYSYDIFSGTKTPSRDKVLALCFALSLSDAETQQLLKITGYPPLYVKLTRDSLIMFALQRQMPLTDVNELLYERNYPLLA